MILASLFLAIGYVLPFLTGQIKEIGNMLASMHLPVPLGFFGNGFTLAMFVSGAFLHSLPGIALRLVLVPALLLTLQRARLLPLREEDS